MLLRIGQEHVERRIRWAAEIEGVLPHVSITTGWRNWEFGRVGIENLAVFDRLQHRIVRGTAALPI